MTEQLRIKQKLRCIYHPSSQGLNEKVNGNRKNNLNEICATTKLNLVDALPLALMSYLMQANRNSHLKPHKKLISCQILIMLLVMMRMCSQVPVESRQKEVLNNSTQSTLETYSWVTPKSQLNSRLLRLWAPHTWGLITTGVMKSVLKVR